MSTKLTWPSKENVAELSFYRASKVSKGNLVLTEFTWQANNFAVFTLSTKFYWLTQETIFWSSVYRAGLVSEEIHYFVI